MVIALLQVLQSSSFAHTGQKMQRLETQKTRLPAEIHQLEAEVAALSSLDRTERAARDRLGMVPARNIEYISVVVKRPPGRCCPGPSSLRAAAEPASEPWWRPLYRRCPSLDDSPAPGKGRSAYAASSR